MSYGSAPPPPWFEILSNGFTFTDVSLFCKFHKQALGIAEPMIG